LYRIAQEICREWPNPSPHALPYLKAMHYLIDMGDNLSSPTGRGTPFTAAAGDVVGKFLRFSKEWTGPTADRLRAELQEQKSSNARPASEPCSSAASRSGGPPSICPLCGTDLCAAGKAVHGTTSLGQVTYMCVACHYFVGTGLDKGHGSLFRVALSGEWTHVYSTSPGKN
jgi:hypothetical protein